MISPSWIVDIVNAALSGIGVVPTASLEVQSCISTRIVLLGSLATTVLVQVLVMSAVVSVAESTLMVTPTGSLSKSEDEL